MTAPTASELRDDCRGCGAPVEPEIVIYVGTPFAQAAYRCPPCQRVWVLTWIDIDNQDGRQ